MISGSCDTQQDHEELFASYYRCYKSVMTYINDKYYYGDNNLPLIPRTLEPLRKMIDEEYDNVSRQLSDAGGKYLLHTHDYVYFAFRNKENIPNLKGLKVIC